MTLYFLDFLNSFDRIFIFLGSCSFDRIFIFLFKIAIFLIIFYVFLIIIDTIRNELEYFFYGDSNSTTVSVYNNSMGSVGSGPEEPQNKLIKLLREAKDEFSYLIKDNYKTLLVLSGSVFIFYIVSLLVSSFHVLFLFLFVFYLLHYIFLFFL